MNDFSISKCISGAWDLTTKHWIMCVVMLVVCVLAYMFNGSMTPTGDYENMTQEDLIRMCSELFTGKNLVAISLGMIVQYVLYAGLYKMAINGYNGTKVDTSAYSMPIVTYFKFILANIVYQILVVVGCCFCIIPGIIIAVRFFFVPYVVLDEPHTEFIDAFNKSWQMTKGHFFGILGLAILLLLINFVGVICCCIGVIFTEVLTIFASVIAYYQLKDNEFMRY